MTFASEPKGVTLDNFMNMTKEAGHKPEIQRLIDLDAVYKDAMNGQLILAPINLEEPGKRILDSGTADVEEMLEEAGLQNTQQRRIIVELGKRAKPELRAQSVNGASAPVRPISAEAKDLQTSFTREQLDGLQGRVRAELENEGGKVEMIVAFTQQPGKD
ncbi:MAG: hypothetical protein Q9209_001257 [Squamulea sp. 1 TL-2023]